MYVHRLSRVGNRQAELALSALPESECNAASSGPQAPVLTLAIGLPGKRKSRPFSLNFCRRVVVTAYSQRKRRLEKRMTPASSTISQYGADRTERRPIPRFALRPQEAADSLGISLSTFLGWVRDGKMPKPTKVGNVSLYDTGALRRAWEALQDGVDGQLARPNPWDE